MFGIGFSAKAGDSDQPYSNNGRQARTIAPLE